MTIALVTGANRGLGYATAHALAALGIRVILTGRNADRTAAAATRLRDEGLDVTPLVLDVTVPASVEAASDQVARTHGGLDILVNNAGILPEATADDEHDFAGRGLFEQTFATNVFGVVNVTEAFLPLLRRSAAGRIVNVSTTMGSLRDQADPGSPYYSTVVPAYQSSKAALNSVTISLAKTLADTGIVVTSVCPGFVQTELTPVNRDHAPLTADDAAAVVVAAATVPPGRASGTFVDRDGPVDW